MAIFEIPISKEQKNDTFNIVLSGVEYVFYIKYNARFDYYTWDLYDKLNTPLIQGQRIISDFCLNYRFTALELPKGRIFGVNIAEDGQEPNKTNLGTRVLISYSED